MPKIVRPTSSRRLPEPNKGWFAYGYQVLFDGSLAVIEADCDVKALQEASRTPDGVWHYFDVPDGSQMQVSILEGKRWNKQIALPLTHYPYVHFDRLSNGKWLISEAASFDQNCPAIVTNGASILKIDLDVDVRHLQASNDGSFWVGYSDSGVFESTGAACNGIARFANGGELIWGYNSARIDLYCAITDCCECINVSAFGAWSVKWPDYTIDRHDIVQKGNLRGRIKLPDAIATDGTTFLLAQSPESFMTKGQDAELTLLEMPPRRSSRRLRKRWTGNISIGNADKPDLLMGRGDTLHAVADGHWYSLTIADLDRQLEENGLGKPAYKTLPKSSGN